MSLSPDHSAAGSLFCGEDASEVVSSDSISDHHSSPSLPLYSPSSDETTISGLIETEAHHMPHLDYLKRCRDRSINVTARQDSINWILKVHSYYRFRPVTAFLSVNYFDRFLSCSSLPQPRGWPLQLLSVACLSLAAKMEEPQVPLLLDLQLFKPAFIFEPKTIQKMELWVMANLNWRLRSVTPFDYLDYFISKLPSSPSNTEPESVNRFISAASDLILRTTRVIDFLGFAPSTIAAAAVLCSTSQGCDIVSNNDQLSLFFHGIPILNERQEMVRSCHQLMEKCVVDTCHSACHNCRRAEVAATTTPPPSSPIGVLDAPTLASRDTRSGTQAEPASKRHRSSVPDVQQR